MRQGAERLGTALKQTAKRETQGTPLRVRVRCHTDPLVPAAPCTLAESSRGKVLAMLAEPVEGDRRTYTPQYAPDKARDTTPAVYVRFHPGALVPAALCVHAPCAGRPALGEARFRT